MGGSMDVDFEDGVKSPYFSLYEDDPMKQPLMQGWPMVVWEVAYSEDEKQSAHDLTRYVACSLSRVQLAIRLNVEHHCTVAGQPWGLKKVMCTLWEANYIETFTTLEESGSESLNHLTRHDKYFADADDYIMPAATKLSCVLKFDG